MQQVNPSVPSDTTSIGPKLRPTSNASGVPGFGRQLESEVQKLDNSSKAGSIGLQHANPAGARQRQETLTPCCNSDDSPIQVASVEGQTSPFGSSAAVHPTEVEPTSSSSELANPSSLDEPGVIEDIREDLAASDLQAFLAVILSSSVDSTRQNLPSKVSEPKRSAKGLPESDGKLDGVALLPGQVSAVLAIHAGLPAETASLVSDSSRITSAIGRTPAEDQMLDGFPTAMDPKLQTALGAVTRSFTAEQSAGTRDNVISLKKPTADTPISEVRRIEERVRQELGATLPNSEEPESQKSVVPRSGAELLNSAERGLESLLKERVEVSMQGESSSRSKEAEPTGNQTTGQTGQLVQGAVGRLLTTLSSRNDDAQRATRTPAGLPGAIDAESLPSIERSTSEANAEQATLVLHSPRHANPPFGEISEAEGKQSMVEVWTHSLGGIEIKNAGQGALADQETSKMGQESSGSRNQGDFPNQSKDLHGELSAREAGKAVSQAEVISRTTLTSRSPKDDDEGLSVLKQAGGTGTNPLAAVSHASSSIGDSSITAAHSPVLSGTNAWEQVQKVDVISQLVEKIGLISRKNDSELVISLKPEFLGRVSLHASMVDKTLVATLIAESPHVKALLESQLPVLQHSLQEQGLPLAKVMVLQGNAWSFFDSNTGQPHFQQDPGSRQAAPHVYRPLGGPQESEEPELSSMSPAVPSSYPSRSINLIA